MADDTSPIVIPLEIDVKKLVADFASATRAVNNFEGSLDSLLAKIDKISGKLDQASGDIDISIQVDSSEAENARGELERLDTGDVTIDVNADYSELLQADRIVGELDTAAPEIAVTTEDSDVIATQSKVDTLDAEAPTIQITTDDTDAENDLNQMKNDLTTIKRLAVIQLLVDAAGAFSAIGGVKGAIESIPGVGSITDLNQAVRDFEAQTGQSFPEIRNIIASTFDDGLAESREQVAKAAAELTQYGVSAEELPDALTSAFNAAAVTGKPVEEILKAQDSIVKNLGGNYSDAADLIVSGYQQGADKGGDFLGLLTEFGPQFKALGIDGAGALSLITQASDAGAGKVQRLGDIFKELNKKITEAVGTKSGAAFDALQELGLFDEAKAVQAGTMTGTDFAQAAIEAASTKGKQGDSLLTQIFGEPVAEFGLDIFKGFDFNAADSLIPEDAAQQSADVLTDSWGGAITELGRTLEDQFLAKLRIGGQSFTDLLDNAKEKVQELADLLQSGKGLPEALEIVLEAPGLAQDIQRFEASVGNFILDLELAIANAQQALGIGDKGAGLRANVAAGAKNQLAFDLTVANPNDIAATINRAITRGVDPAAISDLVTQSTNDLVSQGDVDRAQELLYAVNELPKAFVTLNEGSAQEVSIPFTFDSTANPEQIQAAANAALDQYVATTGQAVLSVGDIPFHLAPEVDTTAAHAAVDDAITLIDSGMQKLQAPLHLFDAPLKSIQDAINSQGGQDLIQNTLTSNAITSAKESTQGQIDWSDPNNAILPPVVVEDTTTALETIATTSTEQLGTVQQSAKDTATQFDTVVVATDELQNAGGEKLMAFATVANTAGEFAQKSWAQFAAVLANVQGAVGNGTDTPRGREGSDTQSTTDTGNKARGGAFGADDTFWVGEEGPELVTFSQPGAVLDAQTSAAIMDSLAMIGSMQMGNTTTINNNNNFDVQSIFNTQNQAQAVSAGATLASRIRSVR